MSRARRSRRSLVRTVLRAIQIVTAGWVAWVVIALETATPAAADNCSVFTDCFQQANSAAEAGFGLALLIALSLILDLFGGMGDGFEGAFGGLGDAWDRALGNLPDGGQSGGGGASGGWEGTSGGENPVDGSAGAGDGGRPDLGPDGRPGYGVSGEWDSPEPDWVDDVSDWIDEVVDGAIGEGGEFGGGGASGTWEPAPEVNPEQPPIAPPGPVPEAPPWPAIPEPVPTPPVPPVPTPPGPAVPTPPVPPVPIPPTPPVPTPPVLPPDVPPPVLPPTVVPPPVLPPGPPDAGPPADGGVTTPPPGQHRWIADESLGYDPAHGGQWNQREYESAQRLIDEYGIDIQRSENPKLDWVDRNGRTYDQMGNFPAQHFDKEWRRGNIQEQILEHVNKADVVVIDGAKWTPEQVARVQGFLDQHGFGPPRVIWVGI